MLEPWQQEIFLSILVCGVFAALMREWLSVELVAIGALFLCVVAGILPVGTSDPSLMRYDALRVFAHPAPIMVACMFILSAALDRTGVVDALGHQFERMAAVSPMRMLFVLMLFVALLSAFMNNTPVVVVFMPIVISICRKKEWKASKYLIPLSYASIVGGTMTIIGTSTNLVAAGILRESTAALVNEGKMKAVATLSMFDVTPKNIFSPLRQLELLGSEKVCVTPPHLCPMFWNPLLQILLLKMFFFFMHFLIVQFFFFFRLNFKYL